VARILENLTELEKLIKRQPFGLITDIDGTISRTTPNLLMAKITKTNRLCLSALVNKLALVSVISGRQSQKVKDMVDIDGVVCIGHYGMERWENNSPLLHPDAQPFVPYVRALMKELEALKSIEGILIQDKWAAISVIYRQSPNIEKARKAILNLLNDSPNAQKLRIITEKKVFGIVPRHS
jgi:trehalose 6-phosphate phosphatase